MATSKGCQILAEFEIAAVMQGRRIPKCKYLAECTGSDLCRRFHLTPKYNLRLSQSAEVFSGNVKPVRA